MTYIYTPLSTSRPEIRVLELHPASFNAPLLCDLHNIPHSSDSQYEALSYTWGAAASPTTPFCIFISGSRHPVRQNLFLALRYLRSETKVRRLWIDALCINQADVAERNAQVARMAEVYRGARRVRVWLGEGNEESLMGMKYLKEINSAIGDVTFDSKEDGRLRRIEDAVIAHFKDSRNKSTWDSIGKLWQRAYWTRIWIIQEIVFGTSRSGQCIIHCGYDSISWETLEVLESAMTRIEQTDELADNEHSDVDLVRSTKGARLDISWFLSIHGEETRTRGMALSYLLVRQGHYQASDLRDKVYALLSMVDWGCDRGGNRAVKRMKVDYGLETAEVYMLALREIVLRERNLGVLCACCRECRRKERTTIELPSWCPDWGTGPMDLCCPARLWSYTKPVYYASGSLDAEVVFSPSEHSETPCLMARGWLLDSISVLDPAFSDTGFLDGESIDFLHRGLPTERTLSEPLSPADEAVWRTVVANRGLLRDEPPASFSRAYQEMTELAPKSSVSQSELAAYVNKAQACLRKRKLCKSTERCLPGLVPHTALDGDVICILIGCALPLILRRVENYFVIIGESYIHGFMNGEISELEIEGSVGRVEFEIH